MGFELKDDLTGPSNFLKPVGSEMNVTYDSQNGTCLKRTGNSTAAYDHGLLSVPFIPEFGNFWQVDFKKQGPVGIYSQIRLNPVDQVGGPAGFGFSFSKTPENIDLLSSFLNEGGIGDFDFKIRDDKWIRLKIQIIEENKIGFFVNGNKEMDFSPYNFPPLLYFSLGASFYEQVTVCYKNLRIKGMA